jgi:hypothetical protein
MFILRKLNGSQIIQITEANVNMQASLPPLSFNCKDYKNRFRNTYKNLTVDNEILVYLTATIFTRRWKASNVINNDVTLVFHFFRSCGETLFLHTSSYSIPKPTICSRSQFIFEGLQGACHEDNINRQHSFLPRDL